MGEGNGGNGGASLVPVGDNELALVIAERSLEQRVGGEAVEKLRTDLELKHPDLKTLFFVPQDFAVCYGVKATLEKIDDSVTKKKYKAFLIERIISYLNESAELRQRKGIFAKLRGEDKHLYVDKDKLTNYALSKLSEQAYKDAFSEQLKRVDEIRRTCGIQYYHNEVIYPINIDSVQQKLEGLIKEASSFIRNFSIVPVNESTEHNVWEAIIPVLQKNSILWGLFSEEKAVPFQASGQSASQRQSENTMPQCTLLEPQYGAVLADKLFMLVEDFNKDLKELVDRLAPFAKKEAKLPQDLQVNLALYNYFINGLYNENGNPLSASYVTGINMALRGINKHLEDVFSSIREFKKLKDTIIYSPSEIRDFILSNTNFELIEHKLFARDIYYFTARKPVN